MTTVCGNGDAGWLAGTVTGTCTPGGSASFDQPFGLAFTPAGTLLVSDVGSFAIWAIDGGSSTLFSGSPGVQGSSPGGVGAATYGSPRGIAISDGGLPGGTIYVTDDGSHTVRLVQYNGDVSETAWNPDAGGPLTGLEQVTLDPQGNVWVADDGSHNVGYFTPDGGFVDLGVSPSPILGPFGVVCDSLGDIYVSDEYGLRIYQVFVDGGTQVLAGNGQAGWDDDQFNPQNASFLGPTALALDSSGQYLYVADQSGIRLITLSVNPSAHTVSALSVSTVAGNPDAAGDVDGTLGRTGTARFNDPQGLAVDSAGNVYVADTGNHKIKMIPHP